MVVVSDDGGSGHGGHGCHSDVGVAVVVVVDACVRTYPTQNKTDKVRIV